MSNVPDKWCLVPVSEDRIKVMATWAGSYLYGSSWKLNSGIKKVEDKGESWLFTGESGSEYDCRKTGYGLNAYGAGILAQGELDVMNEEEATKWIEEQL